MLFADFCLKFQLLVSGHKYVDTRSKKVYSSGVPLTSVTIVPLIQTGSVAFFFLGIVTIVTGFIIVTLVLAMSIP